MKTGRDLLDYLWEQFPATRGHILLNQFISAIELEAYSKGMTDAAKIAEGRPGDFNNMVESWLGFHDAKLAHSISRQILAARDKTTHPE